MNQEFTSNLRAGTAQDSHRTTTTPRCRLCKAPLSETFADLGLSPLANSYITHERLNWPQTFYPLHAYVCSECLLVQLEAIQSPAEIFSDYAYFSSYSNSWLEHCRQYAQDAIARFGLNPSSCVIEAASNDGYLLQFFHQAGIPVLGIEPAANVARAAIERGIPTEVMFLSAETAARVRDKGIAADLLAANNVLAHVPDVHSFVEGIRTLLKPSGICTIEFPHLLNLIRYNEFDTIYHEHYSYLSLGVVERLLSEHGLTVFDVAQLPTHGGSLRICAHRTEQPRFVESSVALVRRLEREDGLDNLTTYRTFSNRVKETKLALWRFFLEARREGKTVAGYGAPAKGNTLLNYCGIGPDLLPYTVDRSPHKQGLYLPGTRIPIAAPERIMETRPDYILILPWNLQDEILAQMAEVRNWGAKFVVPIPEVKILP